MTDYPLQPGWTSRVGGIKPEYLRKAIRETDDAWNAYYAYCDKHGYDEVAQRMALSAEAAEVYQKEMWDLWQEEAMCVPVEIVD